MGSIHPSVALFVPRALLVYQIYLANGLQALFRRFVLPGWGENVCLETETGLEWRISEDPLPVAHCHIAIATSAAYRQIATLPLRQ